MLPKKGKSHHKLPVQGNPRCKCCQKRVKQYLHQPHNKRMTPVLTSTEQMPYFGNKLPRFTFLWQLPRFKLDGEHAMEGVATHVGRTAPVELLQELRLRVCLRQEGKVMRRTFGGNNGRCPRQNTREKKNVWKRLASSAWLLPESQGSVSNTRYTR